MYNTCTIFVRLPIVQVWYNYCTYIVQRPELVPWKPGNEAVTKQPENQGIFGVNNCKYGCYAQKEAQRGCFGDCFWCGRDAHGSWTRIATNYPKIIHKLFFGVTLSSLQGFIVVWHHGSMIVRQKPGCCCSTVRHTEGYGDLSVRHTPEYAGFMVRHTPAFGHPSPRGDGAAAISW